VSAEEKLTAEATFNTSQQVHLNTAFGVANIVLLLGYGARGHIGRWIKPWVTPEGHECTIWLQPALPTKPEKGH